MEKEQPVYEPKGEPSLRNLAASRPATPGSSGPGKRNVGRPKKEAEPKQAPKVFTNEQSKYAVDTMAQVINKNGQDEVAKAWEQINGYERRFKGRLDTTRRPPPNAPASAVLAYRNDLGYQLSEESSVATLKHLYLILLDVLVRGNYAMGNPWGLHVSTLPQVAKRAIHEKDFLQTEFEEIAILHPSWCRPGPELRIIWATVNLIREVQEAESSGSAYVDPQGNIGAEKREKYANL